MSSTSVKCYKGLGTILGAPDHPRSSASSLRRTLSADMSSKKWLAQNGFSPIKKTSSTDHLHVDNSNRSDLDQPSQLDIWNAIQADRHKAEQKQSDMWGSILSQKSSPIPAPYVHPLSKRSRSLSQRSLEICTESLGSETGSDEYSSYHAPSETSDAEQEQDMEEEEKEPIVKEGFKDELDFPEYNRCNIGRKLTPLSTANTTASRRSFPPPLPSLSRPGIHMRPRRVDGRLVLEAVSIPTPSHNFYAQRQDGRLLLTFAKPPSSTNGEGTNQREVIDDVHDGTAPKIEQVGRENEKKEERQSKNREVLFGNDGKIVVEMRPTMIPTGVIDVQLSAYRMKKLMTLTNMNPTPALSLKSEAPVSRVPRMISPSVPSTPAAASFNTYEYCWRTNKTTISLGIKGTLIQQPSLPFSTTSSTSLGTKSYTNRSLVSKNQTPQQEHAHFHQFVVLQANCMDSTLRGCKETRRTSALLFREPCCIATS
ncbi:hypothetical protein Sjap_012531 [Stephania japonica]|uniref:FAF domain-containing protein n=1 Tax=Stephania japonica TaxID=461633 RepID=A0AAP0IW91_9MAGN